MRIILLIFGLLPLRTDLNSLPPELDRILSKNYCLTYSGESRPFLPFDSAGKLKVLKGVINRNENYMVSKSDSDVGILEDSTCFNIDSALKTIAIGPKLSIGNALLVPLYDPYEIFKYAINNKFGFQKYAANGNIIYDFIRIKQDELFANIVIYFNKDHPDGLTIKLIYQQLDIMRQDIIKYKFTTQPSGRAHDKIADFLDFKDGNYKPKGAYKNYLFGNVFLISKKK
jgi:hypothetical protein